MLENPHRGRIVIAGGSGFLGLSLATHLAHAGWSVVVLSRNPPAIDGPWRHVPWDARNLAAWRRELDGASGLVNLVGRSVDCVKTPDHQDEILRSRVEATRVLGRAIRMIESPPPVWVQMSTAHIYGDPHKSPVLKNPPSAMAWRHSLVRRGSRNSLVAFCPASAKSSSGQASSLDEIEERVAAP